MMRTFPRQSLLIAVALVGWWTISDRPGFAAEPPSAEARAPSVKEIEKEVSRLDDIWKAGKHCKYFIEAEKLTERLREVGDEKEAMRVAAGLLETMLSREVKIDKFADYIMAEYLTAHGNARPETVRSDLTAMRGLASCITGYGVYAAMGDELPVIPIEVRRRNVKLLADLLGRVRKEIIPNYKEKPVYLNVAPPVDLGGPGVSGMDPNAIKNPAARAKYIAAIRENVANGLSNSRQRELKKYGDSRVYFSLLRDYMVLTFPGRESESALFTECVKRARLTDKEKKNILEWSKSADPGMRNR